MTTGQAAMRMGVVLISVGVLLIEAGCAAKRVASTSGDQSETMKGKGTAAGAAEIVKEEPLASVDSSLSTPGSTSIPSSAVAPGTRRGTASGAPDTTGLGDIYFDFDRYNIRTDAQPVLEGDARWLRNEQGKSLLIEGHCDERGTLAYNLVLGEKRAKSAKRYLEDLGIPGSRIQTTSYGEVRPFCKDHDEGCWSKNRRDHFVVQ